MALQVPHSFAQPDGQQELGIAASQETGDPAIISKWVTLLFSDTFSLVRLAARDDWHLVRIHDPHATANPFRRSFRRAPGKSRSPRRTNSSQRAGFMRGTRGAVFA